MSRIYEALRRAEAKRSQPDARDAEWSDEAAQELSDDITSLDALVKRLEQRLDRELGSLRQVREDTLEHFASLEVSIDAIEDRLDDAERDDGQETSAELNEQLDRLAAGVSELAERIERELPTLRAELDETIEKRVQATLAQLVGREQTMRDRLEARIDALRRDLDSGMRRHALLIGAVLFIGFVAYVC
jgi:DNA repair exonuclease SbcCD ATPase subunit